MNLWENSILQSFSARLQISFFLSHTKASLYEGVHTKFQKRRTQNIEHEQCPRNRVFINDKEHYLVTCLCLQLKGTWKSTTKNKEVIRSLAVWALSKSDFFCTFSTQQSTITLMWDWHVLWTKVILLEDTVLHLGWEQ